MGPQVFFGNPDSSVVSLVLFWAVLYLWGGSELFLGWRLSRRKSASAVDRDAYSKWILIGSVWGGVGLGIVLAVLFPSAAFTRGRHLLFGVGLALALLGMGLRWYSIWYLGRDFTCEVSTQPGQKVTDTGPYRLVRHPSYTGGLLTVLGLLMCMTNPFAFIGFLVVLGGYAYRIRVEESVLAREVGEPYRRYMRRTKRLVPFVV